MPITLPGPVLTVLRDVTLMKYSNFFTVTMLVYDYIITFGDEVRLIWPWEWRAGKILYLATKYSPFVDVTLFLVFWFNNHLSQDQCKQAFILGVWFVSVGAIISEWILCMRTYAIWGKSNYILVPLLTFVLSVQIIGLWATQTLVESLQSILTLTIWSGIYQWRTSRSPLIKVLYRDGVFYFAVIFIISLTNFAMVTAAPKINHPILTFFLPEVQRVLHSVCTSHIILNLRETSAGESGLGIDGGLDAARMVSTLRFGINRALHRGRDKSKVEIGVEDDFDFTDNTTLKTDNWAVGTYVDVDDIAMTEIRH